VDSCSRLNQQSTTLPIAAREQDVLLQRYFRPVYFEFWRIPKALIPARMAEEPLKDIRPLFELRGRNYLITGGAQGIGFAAARAICDMGGNVAILDIQDKPCDDFLTLGKRFGVKAVYHQTDVTKEESILASFAKAVKDLGAIDGCVPAAGVVIDKPFVDQTWSEFTRIQEINVGGLLPSYSCVYF
jgi:hypothetical protein